MASVDTRWLCDVPLAHRGLHGHGVPENSLAAFAAARDAGVGVELDVRLSADVVPVVFHDRGLGRLAGARGRVATHTATDLAALRLAGTDQGIPSLATTLQVLGDTPVMVEVKADGLRPTSLEPAVAAVLADHPGRACVASFNPLSLRWFRLHAPAVLRVLTASPSSTTLAGRDLRLASLQSTTMVEPVAISYAVAGLDLRAVRQYRERGGTVVTWTVRTLADLVAAREGADNLIFESLSVADVTTNRVR